MIKKPFNVRLHVKSICAAILTFLFLASSGYAGVQEVHLQWDESVDAPFITSYSIYYNIASGPPFPDSGYATHYSYNGIDWYAIDVLFGPYPFTVDKSVTEIYLRLSDDTQTYYFAVTAVDTDGLESDYSNQVSTDGDIPDPDGANSPDSQVSQSEGGGGGGGGGGCFIATAAYGSPLDKHVCILRAFRDHILLPTRWGQDFVTAYYRLSPPMADFIREHGTIRTAVRWTLLPLVGFGWAAVNLGSVPALLIILMMGISVGITIRRFRLEIKPS